MTRGANTLRAGFDDPVIDAQTCFRAILDAMSRPGTLQSLAPLCSPVGRLDTATVAVALTLLDADTPVWLDARACTANVVGHLRFHCSAPVVAERRDAHFALVADASALTTLEPFDAGDDAYPDRSATLLVQARSLRAGRRVRLAGPGVDGETVFDVDGLAHTFADAWANNHALFPRGVDLILTAGTDIVAVPRSVSWTE